MATLGGRGPLVAMTPTNTHASRLHHSYRVSITFPSSIQVQKMEEAKKYWRGRKVVQQNTKVFISLVVSAEGNSSPPLRTTKTGLHENEKQNQRKKQKKTKRKTKVNPSHYSISLFPPACPVLLSTKPIALAQRCQQSVSPRCVWAGARGWTAGCSPLSPWWSSEVQTAYWGTGETQTRGVITSRCAGGYHYR